MDNLYLLSVLERSESEMGFDFHCERVHTIIETGEIMRRGRERGKIKTEDDEAEEAEEEKQETRRLRRQFTTRVEPILDALSPETVNEYFGAKDYETFWQALNTNEEHCNRVIEWLETPIATQMEGEHHY
jgi:hypothetical protein